LKIIMSFLEEKSKILESAFRHRDVFERYGLSSQIDDYRENQACHGADLIQSCIGVHDKTFDKVQELIEGLIAFGWDIVKWLEEDRDFDRASQIIVWLYNSDQFVCDYIELCLGSEGEVGFSEVSEYIR
jgi:hypothetical protein